MTPKVKGVVVVSVAQLIWILGSFDLNFEPIRLGFFFAGARGCQRSESLGSGSDSQPKTSGPGPGGGPGPLAGYPTRSRDDSESSWPAGRLNGRVVAATPLLES